MPAPGLTVLGEWAASVRVETLPPEVVDKVQQGLLDTLGVAVAGGRHPGAGAISALVHDLAGQPQATLLGGAGRSNAALAALHNGYLAHLLDFDDTHLDAIVHVNAPVFGAVLAVAEHRGSPGGDVVAAYAAGLEVSSRIGLALSRGGDYGWHLTGLAGACGAAAGVSRLLGLTSGETGYALALSTTLASGIRTHRGTLTKAMSPGNAAHNGVVAGLAGKNGFTANVGALESGSIGFLETHGRESGPVADGVGVDYRLLDWEAKPYPCGVVIHPAIDAALAVRDEIGSPQRIDWIRVRTNPLALTITGDAAPSDGLKSKFSVFHAVAVAFVAGAPGVEHFTDAWAGALDVVAVRERIDAVADNSLTRDEAVVTVGLADGRQLERHSYARGTRPRRMDREAMVTKFLANVSPVIGETRAERLVDTVLSAVDLPDVTSILQLANASEVVKGSPGGARARR